MWSSSCTSHLYHHDYDWLCIICPFSSKTNWLDMLWGHRLVETSELVVSSFQAGSSPISSIALGQPERISRAPWVSFILQLLPSLSFVRVALCLALRVALRLHFSLLLAFSLMERKPPQASDSPAIAAHSSLHALPWPTWRSRHRSLAAGPAQPGLRMRISSWMLQQNIQSP
jgi:hypothetical protein